MVSMRQRAIERFIAIDRLHKTLFDCQAARMGIHRGQHMTLMCISHAKTPLTQAQLASEMGVSPPAVAVMLGKLEEVGYIRRETDEYDRRKSLIYITDKGTAVLRDTRRLFNEIDMAMFGGMDDETLAEFVKYLTVMENNLKGLITERGEEI